MPLIHGELVVDFREPALLVVDLLPEPQRQFRGINLLEVARAPALPAFDVDPVAASAAGQILPVAEFAFVLRPGARLRL